MNHEILWMSKLPHDRPTGRRTPAVCVEADPKHYGDPHKLKEFIISNISQGISVVLRGFHDARRRSDVPRTAPCLQTLVEELEVAESCEMEVLDQVRRERAEDMLHFRTTVKVWAEAQPDRAASHLGLDCGTLRGQPGRLE
jgi:hypothetical protein